jgi:hypothetical protein
MAGVLVGILIGFFSIPEAIGNPLIAATFPIPKIAILPLLILWLGIGEPPKVAVIALGVFFPMVINVYTGVKNVDPILIKAAISLGSNRWRIIRKVILPGILPMIFAGMKLGIGIALLLVVAADDPPVDVRDVGARPRVSVVHDGDARDVFGTEPVHDHPEREGAVRDGHPVWEDDPGRGVAVVPASLTQLSATKKEGSMPKGFPKEIMEAAFPPCINMLNASFKSGHHLSHTGRFALTSFLTTPSATNSSIDSSASSREIPPRAAMVASVTPPATIAMDIMAPRVSLLKPLLTVLRTPLLTILLANIKFTE